MNRADGAVDIGASVFPVTRGGKLFLNQIEKSFSRLLGRFAARGVLTGFDEVALYISKTRRLPSNFITKAEAEALGWKPKLGNLDAVAPGKSIGGDIFKNAEGLLPKANGRIWYEADINYSGGFRGGRSLTIF